LPSYRTPRIVGIAPRALARASLRRQRKIKRCAAPVPCRCIRAFLFYLYRTHSRIFGLASFCLTCATHAHLFHASSHSFSSRASSGIRRGGRGAAVRRCVGLYRDAHRIAPTHLSFTFVHTGLPGCSSAVLTTTTVFCAPHLIWDPTHIDSASHTHLCLTAFRLTSSLDSEGWVLPYTIRSLRMPAGSWIMLSSPDSGGKRQTTGRASAQIGFACLGWMGLWFAFSLHCTLRVSLACVLYADHTRCLVLSSFSCCCLSLSASSSLHSVFCRAPP